MDTLQSTSNYISPTVVAVLCKKFQSHSDQLITRILQHFVKQESLDEVQYKQLKPSNRQTKFRSGNRGVTSALQYSKAGGSWLPTQQRMIGDIVFESTDKLVIQPRWKAHLIAAQQQLLDDNTTRCRKRNAMHQLPTTQDPGVYTVYKKRCILH